MKSIRTIDEYRETGKEFCVTKGSEHYANEFEPLEFAIANSCYEDFCLMNIIKYVTRFKKRRDVNDLKKIADYAHILAGVKLVKIRKETESEEIKDARVQRDCNNENS